MAQDDKKVKTQAAPAAVATMSKASKKLNTAPLKKTKSPSSPSEAAAAIRKANPPAETPGQRAARRNAIRNNIPKSKKMEARKTQNKIRAAIPRPPLNRQDAEAIAGGQNAAAILKRRRAKNRGAAGRIRAGGKE